MLDLDPGMCIELQTIADNGPRNGASTSPFAWALASDDVLQDAQKHKSVGQMMMVHTLTPGGLHAFESLLPGFTEDATDQGAEQLDKNAILDDKIAIVSIRPCLSSVWA